MKKLQRRQLTEGSDSVGGKLGDFNQPDISIQNTKDSNNSITIKKSDLKMSQ